MYFDDILGNKTSAPITPSKPAPSGGGYFSDIFGKTEQKPQGAQVTTDINPISRIFSGDKAGERKISAYTPLDYLLNGAVFAGAGALESSFKRAKATKKKKDAGGGISLADLAAIHPLNPANWSGSFENLKPENRKTAYEVTRENLPDNPYAAATAFVADLAAPTPSIGKIARATGATKLASKAGEVVANTKVGQAVAPVVDKIKKVAQSKLVYRGGQPTAYAEKAEEAIRESQQGMEQAKKIGTLLSEGLTNAEQVRLGQIIKGGVTTGKTDEKLVEKAKEARKMIDDLSQQVVDQAMVGRETQLTPKGLSSYLLNALTRDTKATKPTTELAGEVEKTTAPVMPEQPMGVTTPPEGGIPLTHTYEQPQAKTILPVETTVKEAETGGLKINEQTVKTIQENMGKYLPRLYTKYEQNPEGLVKFLSTNKGSVIRDRLMKRKDIPDDVRTAMGEILNPAYPAAKAVAQMSDMVAKSKLFRFVNDNFAQLEPVAEDMKQIPDSPTFGILAGKWVQSEIADDLIGVTKREPNSIFKKALNLWKQGKLLYNPATRARNQMSNMMLMSTVGGMPSYAVMNPKTWIDAGIELKDQGTLYKALKNETDLFGTTFYGNEIAPFLDEFTKFQSQNAFQRFTETAKKIPQALGSSYEWQEQLGKMALAKYWIDQGKTVKEAAAMAEKALFNYQKVPSAIKKLRDIPFGYPFITFTYFAVPATAKALVDNPKGIGRLSRTGQNIEAEAKQQLGKVDKSQLPEYMQKGQYLRLPWQSQGRDLYLDLGYILPWGNIDDRPALLGEPQNPAYVLMADVFRNKSAFTGKEIYKNTDSDTEKTKKVADYIYKTLMPPLAPGGLSADSTIKGGYSFEKIVDAWRQRPDYFGRLREMPSVLADVLLGLKATPIDYGETKRIQDSTRVGQIRDLQQQIRTTSLDKRLFPEEKQRMIKSLRAKMEALQ